MQISNNSDVHFWHLADIQFAPTNVCFRGVKRTSSGLGVMSASDPKQTLAKLSALRRKAAIVLKRLFEMSIHRRGYIASIRAKSRQATPEGRVRRVGSCLPRL